MVWLGLLAWPRVARAGIRENEPDTLDCVHSTRSRRKEAMLRLLFV